MKKILLVIDNLGSGGAQNQITLLAIGLKNKGYDVTVFTYYPQDFFKSRLDENSIKLIITTKKDKLGLNVVFSLIKFLKINKFDVVISYLDTPNLYVSIAKLFINFKLIISYRSSTSFSNLTYFKKNIKIWVNNVADFIVSNSHHEKENWINYQPVVKNKFKTIYNLVVQPKINKLNFNFKSKELRILSVGTLSPLKNVEYIINSIYNLKKSGFGNFHYTWIGRKYFNNHDDLYYNKILELITFYDLSNNFTFLEPERNIDSYYLENDVLILASLTEGLPNVVCEAMSFGMPVIVSNVLDHPKLILNNINGFCFNALDPNSLSEKLQEFSRLSFDKRNEMSFNNLKRSKELFNEDIIIAEYENLFFN